MYFEDLKKKEEVRQKLIEEKEMQGFTGKPIINKKSQQIKRKLDDLIEWKGLQDKKREGELQKKQLMEYQELQQLQSHRVVSKQSEKLLETKYKGSLKESVEQRLLRDAGNRQKKRQQSTQQVYEVSQLGSSQRNNKSGGSLRRSERSRSMKNRDQT